MTLESDLQVALAFNLLDIESLESSEQESAASVDRKTSSLKTILTNKYMLVLVWFI